MQMLNVWLDSTIAEHVSDEKNSWEPQIFWAKYFHHLLVHLNSCVARLWIALFFRWVGFTHLGPLLVRPRLKWFSSEMKKIFRMKKYFVTFAASQQTRPCGSYSWKGWRWGWDLSSWSVRQMLREWHSWSCFRTERGSGGCSNPWTEPCWRWRSCSRREGWKIQRCKISARSEPILESFSVCLHIYIVHIFMVWLDRFCQERFQIERIENISKHWKYFAKLILSQLWSDLKNN